MSTEGRSNKNGTGIESKPPAKHRRDLTKFQTRILAVLADEPRYGLAIKHALEAYYQTEVNHGRLYPNLDDLVQEDLVDKSELDKRTNKYALTDQGDAVLRSEVDWLVDHSVENGQTVTSTTTGGGD